MSTPELSGPPAPGQTQPGPFTDANPPELSGPPAPGQTQPGPFTDVNPSGVADAGVSGAWRRFVHAIGRDVPNLVNASKVQRIKLRALGRKELR